MPGWGCSRFWPACCQGRLSAERFIYERLKCLGNQCGESFWGSFLVYPRGLQDCWASVWSFFVIWRFPLNDGHPRKIRPFEYWNGLKPMVTWEFHIFRKSQMTIFNHIHRYSWMAFPQSQRIDKCICMGFDHIFILSYYHFIILLYYHLIMLSCYHIIILSCYVMFYCIILSPDHFPRESENVYLGIYLYLYYIDLFLYVYIYIYIHIYIYIYLTIHVELYIYIQL